MKPTSDAAWRIETREATKSLAKALSLVVPSEVRSLLTNMHSPRSPKETYAGNDFQQTENTKWCGG